jgi:hypothetical protein
METKSAARYLEQRQKQEAEIRDRLAEAKDGLILVKPPYFGTSVGRKPVAAGLSDWPRVRSSRSK